MSQIMMLPATEHKPVPMALAYAAVFDAWHLRWRSEPWTDRSAAAVEAYVEASEKHCVYESATGGYVAGLNAKYEDIEDDIAQWLADGNHQRTVQVEGHFWYQSAELEFKVLCQAWIADMLAVQVAHRFDGHGEFL